MNRSEKLYKLTEKGREKLCARYYHPNGREPFTLINIKPIDSRTFNKIRDGLGVRRGRIIALFRILSLALESDDYEPVEPTAPSLPPPADSPLVKVVDRRRIPARSLLIAGAVALAILVFIIPRVVDTQEPPPKPDVLIQQLFELRNPGGAETEKIRRERAEICLELAEMAWAAWYRNQDEIWVARLQSVGSELESSLDWLARNDRPESVKLAAALSRYWSRLGRLPEHERWLLPASDLSLPLDPGERARALLALSAIHIGSMSNASGRALQHAIDSERLFVLARNPAGAAMARRMRGIQQWILGLNDQAEITSRESLRMSLKAVDPVGAALAQLQVARYCVRGNLLSDGRPKAMEEAEHALNRFRALGNRWGENEALDIIQVNAGELPRYPEMERHIQIAIDACRKESTDEDPAVRKLAWEYLGQIGVRNGDARMQAEGLLGLYQNDRTPAPHVRKWRRLGACLKHCSHLKGYGGLWVNMQKTRLEMTPIHLPNFNRALAEGRRIPLTVAIRRWNEL